MTTVSSNPFTITVTQQNGGISGLEFPSNGDPTDAFVAFQFHDPHLDGLPLFGPAGQGTTYIYKYRPRRQSGYYTVFFYSRGDGGVATSTSSYYGAHPYPYQPGGPDSANHVWEIAMRGDNVYTSAGAGTTHSLVYDEWRTVALRVVRNGPDSKTATLWVNLPSQADRDVIVKTITASGWGESPEPSPKLTFGDAPWYASLPWKHERLSGILRGLKVFNKALSTADILSEAASEELVTSEGQQNIWYHKPNPKPNDLLCDAGTGREPVWAESTTASLWTP